MPEVISLQSAWERFISTLPQEAGKAEIQWRDDIERPRRSRATIVLPPSPNTLFIRLADGEQFLFTDITSEEGDYYDPPRIAGVWFGGTDENPFLAELRRDIEIRECIRFFMEGKEDAEQTFYHTLKPREISRLEKVTGRECLRQGDIFAVPSGFSLVQWELLVDTYFGWGMERYEGVYNLFRTRHQFRGTMIRVDRGTRGMGTVLVCSGVIEAPDHTLLELPESEQVWYLDQTTHLSDPENAD